jgi:hypothetical protein
MWQRLISHIFGVFAVLGKVIRGKGRFGVDLPPGGVWRVVVNCMKLMTSKPRPTNPSEISSAGGFWGR